MTTAGRYDLTNPKTGLRYVLYIRENGTAHIGPNDGRVLTGQEISLSTAEELLQKFIHSDSVEHR